MVGQVDRRGLREWLAQRVTAVLIAVYTVFLITYLLKHPDASYEQWKSLFVCTWMKVATMIVIISIVWHAWIGLWTVFTDYVKCHIARLILQIGVILLLAAYFIWVIDILWG